MARASARARDASLALAEATTAYVAGLVGVRGLRFALNTSVAVLVLSLPFAATAASRASTPPASIGSSGEAADAGRAQTSARGTFSTSRNPVTAAADPGRPVQELTIHEGDTLATMANYYDVSVEAIAFANGMTEARALEPGQKLLVPPAEGALYTVREGDTVEGVAARFKVDPSVIMSYNRLYFEPEHFAPGQLIFVRGAELPGLGQPARVASAVLAGPSFAGSPRRTGRLSWPVAGTITQYFWWGHTGVDVAAPYGTGIGASDDGVVSATGWVAVGGLRVCVQHAGNLETCYYHTSAVYVSVGQPVARGQVIAAIGLTGVTTGPHVHWECKLGSQFVDCLGL
jgi:murein DD-endopeptidase MepM/ murein hydrolase activator NlpD